MNGGGGSGECPTRVKGRENCPGGAYVWVLCPEKLKMYLFNKSFPP